VKAFYDKDGIELYHGLCLDVMAELEPASFDAVVADLPYGTTDAPWDSTIPLDALWREYRRLCKPRAAIVLTAREPFTSVLVMSNIANYRHKWVWNKGQTGNFTLAKFMPLQIEEDVIVFGFQPPNYYPQMRTGPARFKGGARTGAALWSGIKHGTSTYNDQYYPVNIIPLTNPREGKLHPTEKPLALMELLLLHYTLPGDRILDNTCGSGTTLRAAKNLRRRAVGIEMLEQYCQVTVKRLEPQFEAAIVAPDVALDDLPMFAPLGAAD
jgi:site-specific DNA-methyltransferase (adenine-specific)